MKIRESSTAIRDGRRFKQSKSWAILDDDGTVIKKFTSLEDAKEFVIDYNAAKSEFETLTEHEINLVKYNDHPAAYCGVDCPNCPVGLMKLCENYDNFKIIIAHSGNKT